MDKNNSLNEFIKNIDVHSFAEILENWNTGKNIKKKLEETDIIRDFRTYFEIFLAYLFNDNIPFFQKQALLSYQYNLIHSYLVLYPGFILSLYTGNLNSYRNIPLFFTEMIKRFNITQFIDKSEEEIGDLLQNYFDIKHSTIKFSGLESYEICTPIKLNAIDYRKYDTDDSHPYNTTNFFIWGEETTYKKEKTNHPSEVTYWLAKEVGDGFGFDILRFDSNREKEILIEVKTGESWKFELTTNEYKTMIDCCKHGGIYQIYKYTYNGNSNFILDIYLYDSNTGLLIDEDGNSYSLEEITRDSNYYKRTNYQIIPTTKQKILTKKND